MKPKEPKKAKLFAELNGVKLYKAHAYVDGASVPSGEIKGGYKSAPKTLSGEAALELGSSGGALVLSAKQLHELGFANK